MSQASPTNPVAGVAAGVPFLAFPPPASSSARNGAPLIVAWHLMDPPRSEAAFAAAVPMKGLPAWRIYLGLPLCGSRLPEGSYEALMRLFFEDAVLKGYQPIALQGAAEFPAALTEIRRQLGLVGPVGPLGLVGGSMGSAIAQLVLTETAPAAGIDISAAVLLSPIAQLHPMVNAIGRRYNLTYPWTAAALRFAERLDFVARASDVVRAGQPAIRLIVGGNDDRDGFIEPVQRLHSALAERYSDPRRVDLIVVPGMAHALAEEPGVAPAPQTLHAATVDQHTSAWFRAHLPGCMEME